VHIIVLMHGLFLECGFLTGWLFQGVLPWAPLGGVSAVPVIPRRFRVPFLHLIRTLRTAVF
jgi:hypothetical protein